MIEPTKRIVGPWSWDIRIKRVTLSAENGRRQNESDVDCWQSTLEKHVGWLIAVRAARQAPFRLIEDESDW